MISSKHDQETDEREVIRRNNYRMAMFEHGPWITLKENGKETHKCILCGKVVNELPRRLR